MSVQDEEMDDWIREQLQDQEADENTEGWSELEEEYARLQENLRDFYEYEAELEWYENNSYSEMHDQFILEIIGLKEILESTVQSGHEQTTYKMIYAHSVTLLESFLGDTIKSLIISNEKFFSNAATNVDELKKARFSLSDIAKQRDGVVGLAVIKLSEVLYHNIPKVKRIYESVLGESLDTDIGKIDQITSTRHDIVHRNGKTTDGEKIEISKEIVEVAIQDIESFVNSLQTSINRAENG